MTLDHMLRRAFSLSLLSIICTLGLGQTCFQRLESCFCFDILITSSISTGLATGGYASVLNKEGFPGWRSTHYLKYDGCGDEIYHRGFSNVYAGTGYYYGNPFYTTHMATNSLGTVATAGLVTSGPGFSPLQAYIMTAFPGFRRYIGGPTDGINPKQLVVNDLNYTYAICSAPGSIYFITKLNPSGGVSFMRQLPYQLKAAVHWPGNLVLFGADELYFYNQSTHTLSGKRFAGLDIHSVSNTQDLKLMVHSTGPNPASPSEQVPYLTKIDHTGAIIWSKYYAPIVVDTIEKGITCQDGGYAIAGVANGKSFLLKTNEHGDFLWARFYPEVPLDSGQALTGFSGETGNDGFIYNTWITLDDMIPGTNLENPVITKVDAEGRHPCNDSSVTLTAYSTSISLSPISNVTTPISYPTSSSSSIGSPYSSVSYDLYFCEKTEHSPLGFDIEIPHSLCYAGYYTFETTFPLAYTEYQWSLNGVLLGNTLPYLTVLLSEDTNTISLVALNNCGRYDSASVEFILEPYDFSLVRDTFCYGDSILMDPGYEGFTHVWGTGDTSQTMYATAAGPQYVTSYDEHGCAATTAFSNFVPPPFSVSLPEFTALCGNDSLTAHYTGFFSSIEWSNGSTTPSTLVDSIGVYAVTVENLWECTDSDTTTVVSIAVPQKPDLGANAIICVNDSIQLASAVGFLAYSWSTSETSSEITVSSTGEYILTAIDSSGCVVSDSISIYVLPAPSPNLGPDTLFCDSIAYMLSTEGSFAEYSWSTGDTTSSLFIESPGVYTVSLVDSNGCDNMDSILIEHSVTIHPDLGNDTTICPDSSLLLSMVTDFSSYVWSTGETSPTISASLEGEYIVSVVDTHGCPSADTVEISLIPDASPGLPADTSFCEGESFIVSSIGTYPGYLWSNGNTTSDILVESPGTYVLSVTDVNGCIHTNSIEVGEYLTITPNLGTDTLICPEDSLSLSAEFSYSQYSWSTGDSSTSILTSGPGTYSLTVVDSNGCMNSDSILIDTLLVLAPGLPEELSYCEDDVVLVIPTGTFSSYVWSGGETTSSLVAYAAGVYGLTVTDANGCSSSASTLISENATTTPDLGPDTFLCPEEEYLLEASGSYSSYEWSTGESTSSIIVSAPASYAVEVIDSNGCATDTFVMIGKYEVVPPDLGNDTSYCAGDTLALSSMGSYLEYLWSTGETSASILLTTPGNYAITVSDLNGCASADTLHVIEYDLPVVTLGNDTSICEGESLLLDAANAGMSYVWCHGASSQTILASLSNTYCVEVTSLNDCVASDTLQLTVNPNPTPDLGHDTTFCEGSPYTLSSGMFASYSWSSGETSMDISVSNSDTYCLTVTSTEGCEGTDCVALEMTRIPAAFISFNPTLCPLVEFSGLDTVGSATFWEWDFGDGIGTANIQDTSYTYGGFGVYSVQLIAGNECGTSMRTEFVNINCLVGREHENLDSPPFIYPNPTSGMVYFQFEKEPSYPIQVQVFDLRGKMLLSQSPQSKKEFTLDLSSLANGTYLIHTTSGTTQWNHTSIVIK